MKKGIILLVGLGVLFAVFSLLYKNNLARKTIPSNDKPSEANVAEEENLADSQLKEKIGQMIMVGFRGTEAAEGSDIYKIIKDVKIGGVALSDYDVPSKSFPRNIVNPEQTKKLIFDLQKYSNNNLFVAVDAEGGNINRLKPEYGFLPIISPQKMGQDKTLKTVEKESEKLAKELKDLGFNMNFAPVIDLNINPKNPIIGALGRSFSSDSEIVTDNARIFIENHFKNNIITVEKHFPGHGSSSEDSHLKMPDVTNTYKKEELVPYQKLNSEGLLGAIMVAHIVDKNIDANFPATLSPSFLQNILRDQIGFKGVIISDDMQMSAISDNYEFEEAIVDAINAGCDVVCFLNNSSSGYDKDMAYKIRDAIFNAVKESRIEEKRITESYNRILNLKKQFRIIQPSSSEIKSQDFKLIGEQNPISFNEALDIANYVSTKTEIRPAFLLAVLQEELSLVNKFGMCYLENFKTGEGITAFGEKISRVMNPQRDVPGFLSIAEELKKDPLKMPVTCPMSFGWGGAMGPADFIPSTWIKYKDKIEEITGKAADPWNIQDAFLASGLYLSDSGAALKTSIGEWNAAMIYFSGSADSPYTWYADGALEISDKIQLDVDVIIKK